eukprot:COSAG01_NODE_1696_length_9461_cov_8.289010_6_plen_122_part_00
MIEQKNESHGSARSESQRKREMITRSGSISTDQVHMSLKATQVHMSLKATENCVGADADLVAADTQCRCHGRATALLSSLSATAARRDPDTRLCSTCVQRNDSNAPRTRRGSAHPRPAPAL